MTTQSQLAKFNTVSLGLIFIARFVCLLQDTVFLSVLVTAEVDLSLDGVNSCSLIHPYSCTFPFVNRRLQCRERRFENRRGRKKKSGKNDL